MAEHLLDGDFSKATEHWDSKATEHWHPNDVHTKLMDELFSTNLPSANKRPDLPEHLALDLNQAQESPREETHSASALADSVLRQLGAGMYGEVKEHPYRLGMEAGVAGAATLATMLTWNPRLHAAVEIASSIYGIYEFGKEALHLADQAAVIADKNSSQTALDIANQNIRNIGANTTDVLALTAGGALAMGGLGAAVNGHAEFLAPSNFSSGLNNSFKLIAADNYLVPHQVSKVVDSWVNQLDTQKQ